MVKSDNPNSFVGRYGQIRLPAAHKWLWDRQGAHAAFGCVVAAVGGFGVWFGEWGLLVLAAIVTHLFLRYEVTEDDSINDHAYVDIGGYLTGFAVVVVATTAAVVARALGVFPW